MRMRHQLTPAKLVPASILQTFVPSRPPHLPVCGRKEAPSQALAGTSRPAPTGYRSFRQDFPVHLHEPRPIVQVIDDRQHRQAEFQAGLLGADGPAAWKFSVVEFARFQALRKSSRTLTRAVRLDSGSAAASKRITALPFASAVSLAAIFPAFEIVRA